MPVSRRFVILDRDGVINRDSPDYIKTPGEWQPLEGSLQALAALTRAGFELAVVTNQSGIGRGLLSEATLMDIHDKMLRAVARAGGRITAVYYCPHMPGEGCGCRKPEPGMLHRLEKDFGFELEGTPLIGDKPSDMELARRVGARPILVGAPRTGGAEVYPDLATATQALLTESAP